MRWRASSLWLLGLLIGCGPGTSSARVTNQGTATRSAGAGAETTNTNRGQTQIAPGATFEHPLETCGAMEGYVAVSRFVCSGGEVPLQGNPELGAHARLGSSGSHMRGSSFMDSHIVDIYQVPCADGPVQVYVCLYHCAPGRSPYE